MRDSSSSTFASLFRLFSMFTFYLILSLYSIVRTGCGIFNPFSHDYGKKSGLISYSALEMLSSESIMEAAISTPPSEPYASHSFIQHWGFTRWCEEGESEIIITCCCQVTETEAEQKTGPAPFDGITPQAPPSSTFFCVLPLSPSHTPFHGSE